MPSILIPTLSTGIAITNNHVNLKVYTTISQVSGEMAGRKKQDRTSLHARVASTTPKTVSEIALAMGFIYDGKGSVGAMLDAIAQGKIILITANESHKSG